MNPSNARLSQTARTILLVEDLDDDVFFFKQALKRAGIQAVLHVASDGAEAVDYLTNKGEFSSAALYPRPDVVFLDLKMPNMNGFEVLEWMKEYPPDFSLKVIVLTGSEEPGDRARARELGAAAYLIKPPSPTDLATLLGPVQSATADSAAQM